MSYLKSLLFNFLICFFSNYLIPGVDVVNITKIPHIGADIPFAIVMGIFNSLIYPVLKLIDHRVSVFRIAAVAFVMNFAVYAILKILPIGIEISFFWGYFIASAIVTLGSFFTNILVLRRAAHHEASMHNQFDMSHSSKNNEP